MTPEERWKGGPVEALTEKQREALKLLGGPYRYILFYGGARSGKTFLLCRAIAIRALKAPGSRHLIARFRAAHVKRYIWYDTWPKMMKCCFPEVRYAANKIDNFWTFPNGSEVWLGGLDDKERSDKILGAEYSTIYFNECSEISWPTTEKAKTRLAQVSFDTDGNRLRQKFYFDCNPPIQSHWAHRLFIEKREPDTGEPLPDPENYASIRINPEHNRQNLDEEALLSLQRLSARQRARFWAGEWGSANENALWTFELIERARVSKPPEFFTRVVIGVDPSGTKGAEEDTRSDQVGIVVVGLGADGLAYVIEDLTMKARPNVWARAIVTAYMRHEADVVVAEINFGGAMVQEVVRSAASEMKTRINFREVTASRGKVVRAEPISTLYGDFSSNAPSKVRHVGNFPELEDQLCAFTTQGYMGDRSPDRADALIWALSELFPGMTRKVARPGLEVEGVGGFNPLNY